MTSAKTGWHTVLGLDVYFEDGRAVRGIKLDHNGSQVTVYIYRATRDGGWSSVDSLTEAALRAGMKRGTIGLF